MRLSRFSREAEIDVVESPYVPRPLQAKVHRSPKRFKICVAHRRFGKSFLCTGEILEHSLNLNRPNMELSPPRYAFIAPTSDMAYDLGFQPMKRFLGDWPHWTKETKPYTITYPSMARPDIMVTVHFIGAHSIDNYRGRHLDGAVVDEYSEMPGSVWKAVVYPMLSDYQGWAIIIGTPKGRNPFYKLYKEKQNDSTWDTFYFPVSMTGYVLEEELRTQRRELGPELYGQEFELDWLAAMVGAYYAKLLNQADAEGRIGFFPHDPNVPVSTAWDLGIHDSMVIWWYQQIGSEIRIIDHHEEDGLSLIDACALVRERRDGPKPEGPDDPQTGNLYNYKQHHFPHDLKTRELSTGVVREEIAVKDLRGFGKVIVQPKGSVEDGIEGCRRILPRCRFHSKTSNGVDMLSLYRVARDEKLDINKKPIKNYSSHSADGFRVLAGAITKSGFGRIPDLEDVEAEAEAEIDHSAPVEDLMRRYSKGATLYPGRLGGN